MAMDTTLRVEEECATTLAVIAFLEKDVLLRLETLLKVCALEP
jgi:hypothetical protein